MCGGERVPARLQGEVGRGGLPLRPVVDGEATLTSKVSTRRRRGSLLVGRVIECSDSECDGDSDDETRL